MLRHPAHFIAFGGGTGISPIAPGTFGSLLALPIFWAMGPRLDTGAYLLAFALMFAIGVWACEVTGRTLRQPDHGGIVWDEITAFLLVLFFTPAYGYWQALAFLVFRFFDIVKPPPIRYYERLVKGGLGVMIDDLIAAAYTLLALALVHAVVE